MERSFSERVLEAAARIPRGRVTTYSELAAAAGRPGASRAVGTIMRRNEHPDAIPCYRVVRSDGFIGRYSNGGPDEKARRLKREGIEVRDGRVDLVKYLHRLKGSG